jgi:uncharacterized protein YciI
MQFFVYGRDRAGTGDSRRALLKEHWAFMRRYADALIARGPTTAADGRTLTGSLHIVELATAAAAQAFAGDDPLATGGVFDTIMVHRFANLAGRTMWQFSGDPSNPRFLFIGEARAGARVNRRELCEAQSRYLAERDRAAHVILFGPLLGADGESWEGTAMLLETPDAGTAEALVAGDPAAPHYARTRLLRWRFGGEENLRDVAIPGGP